jgi:hypothetical protein
MNRRKFLNLFGLGAAAFTLDPELLLWTPGAKTIFIPPPASYDAITAAILKYMNPKILDSIFADTPLLTYLRDRAYIL